MSKKQIGAYLEIDPDSFEGWDRVELLLSTLAQGFRYEDEDIKFKMIYKPDNMSSPPSIGIKVTYYSKDTEN